VQEEEELAIQQVHGAFLLFKRVNDCYTKGDELVNPSVKGKETLASILHTYSLEQMTNQDFFCKYEGRLFQVRLSYIDQMNHLLLIFSDITKVSDLEGYT